MSNSANVARQLSGTNEHDMEQELTKNLSSNKENEKVLGLYWDTEKDVLKFDVELLKGSRAPTKRELLRTMMSVFDPMGMLSHYMFHIKAVFQDACRLKLNWDPVLEQRMLERWKIWIDVLPEIGKITIPRNYSIKFMKAEVELHLLTDASELAYAAVAYFVIKDAEKNEVVLVAAKSKSVQLSYECPFHGWN